VIQSNLTITHDIGHGRTEEVTGLRIMPFLYNDKVHIKHGGEVYVIDVVTGENQKVDYPVPEGNVVIGKFVISDKMVTNSETGETLIEPNYDSSVTFTGTNIFRTEGQEVLRYRPSTMGIDGIYDVVYKSPNSSTTFFILDDEYLIVRDNVGTFLYKFVDGDINGEFVTEITV
jgi:hypothetical protein